MGLLSESDPTDHALATIASILDFGDSQRSSAVEKPVSEEKAPALVPADVDGYFKVGPGPIEAIRFKWTVRRTESGEYFVDERIGENSAAIANGPMDKEAAIKFVDDRESQARRRFNELRHEIAGRATALDVISKGEL